MPYFENMAYLNVAKSAILKIEYSLVCSQSKPTTDNYFLAAFISPKFTTNPFNFFFFLAWFL